MPELGRKYTCYSCHTKFYDLGKPVPLCPKCGADQRDADETPVYVAPRRGRTVVEEPVEDDDFAPAAAAGGEAADEEAEDEFVPADDREEEAEEEDEEEY
ncbi:MAG TPA: FYDLN acid domain-containing protein [Thermoanaerobaculia bacterium]|nr:FYDLN acid domain-containing protein [Thermoanaerobaculia bacterium]